MAGRLKRMHDPDTDAITGYVFDGRKYAPKDFENVLRDMAGKNDPWVAKALELEDFAHLREELQPINAEEATKQIGDLKAALNDPDVKDPDKKRTYRKRLQQLMKIQAEQSKVRAVQGPSGATGAGKLGSTQTGYQDPRVAGKTITAEEYRGLRARGYSDKEIRATYTVTK